MEEPQNTQNTSKLDQEPPVNSEVPHEEVKNSEVVVNPVETSPKPEENPASESKLAVPQDSKENLNKESLEDEMNKVSNELNEAQKEEMIEEKKNDEEEVKHDDDEEEVEIEAEESIPEEEFQQLLKEYEAKKVVEEAKSEELREALIEPSKKKKVKKIIKKPKDKLEVSEVFEEQSELVNYFKERLEEELDKFSEELWTKDCNGFVHDFLKDSYKLKMFVWIESAGLNFSYIEPPVFDENSYDTDFAYFLKIPNENNVYPEITPINIINFLVGGTIKQNHLNGLLKSMNGLFIPTFVKDPSWPDNIKKEFLSQLHKFMAYLTEVSHKQQNFTELYIPNEDLNDVEAAQQDKDLIQRLETTLIYWYRQIKEVVNNQDSSHESENAGPLEEIKYWRSRKENLSYIDEQLEKEELKKITQILHNVDSSYVKSFEDLTKNIKTGSIEAEDNLLFLKSLYDPCKKLGETTPQEIPSLLPDLLNRVRMIWEKSKYYKTPERISGLLHKISNEIIKRCRETININDMLDGNVEKCMQDLENSIECGKIWRACYEKTAGIINKKNKNNKWDFNLNSIFAQVDAFVQRCDELKDICEGQLQFARKGADNQLPHFGGSRGPEIVNILEEIKLAFRKYIDKIRNSEDIKDKILDVKATKWHDEFNIFKNGMKDLDVMYKNIINSAFESVTTVEQGVQMLEAFDYLAKRDNIKEHVKKKAQEVLALFVNELEDTKTEYELKKNIVIPLGHGKHSGYGIWVRSLIHRMEKMKNAIDKLSFVKEELKSQALKKYDDYFQRFRQYILNQKFKEWKDENKEFEDPEGGNNVEVRLNKAVLIKIEENDDTFKKELLRSKAGHLESHFDKQLIKLLIESVAWKKLSSFGIVIPQYADDFAMLQRESLRVLREYVMLVVRDYNAIIDSMDDTEKKLFKQHLEMTEKVINTGVSVGNKKLKWSSKMALEGFVRDCRRSCAELSNKITVFKNNMQKISDKCQEISSKILISINKKTVYELRTFEDEQEKHKKVLSTRLKSLLEEIRGTLCDTYEYFVFQRPEIQQVWFSYVRQIDNRIEEALKKAVKISLIDLYNVVGEEKNIPIFRLSVELESNTIVFKPGTQDLINMVRQTIASMTELLKDFSRMEILIQEERRIKLEEAAINQEKEAKNNKLTYNSNLNLKKDKKLDVSLGFEDGSEHKKLESFYERISDDHDVEKYTTKILSSLKRATEGLQDRLDPWKKRPDLYNKTNSKERFAKMMVERNEPVSSLKSHIENFENIQNEIQAQHSTDKFRCIVLDNANIKTTLVDIMILYQNAFLHAIQERAVSDLHNLHNLFLQTEMTFSIIPSDLQHLKKNMDFWNKLNGDKQKIEEQLGPLEDKFKLLDEYSNSIALKEEDVVKRNTLREEWGKFLSLLEREAETNKKVHNDLYYETIKSLENFMKDTSDNRDRFIKEAPFNSVHFTVEGAFSALEKYRQNVKELRKAEEDKRFGVELFKINYAPNADLEYVEKEIKNLEEVWNLKNEWDNKWKDFSAIKFNGADLDQLEDLSDDFQKTIKGYSKELGKLDVVQGLKATIDNFKLTLPLIRNLREPYMRESHWNSLSKHLGSLIEPESENFTLKEVFKLNLIQHAEAVREVCDVAKEEFKIESALKKIEEKWLDFNIEMEPHKKTFKVRKADDIFAVLEDHMATLSSQKTTMFYYSFKTQIEHWEITLQNILETLENLLLVQRQWIYLESIFSSTTNDQEKQLLGDMNKFSFVNTKISNHMQRIHDTRNVKKSLCVEGFLTDLKELSRKLEESQKILFQLLERKRKEFPRFYFLSNDDLFELLGNSKDPSRINKHIKKCFEGIKKLEIVAASIPGRKNNEGWEVVSMTSPDQEMVKFNNKVLCELEIENWMKQVERMMRETLKKLLKLCHSGISNRREGMKWVDKWIQTWPGQLLITASQIFWTSEELTAINNLYEKDKQDKNKIWKGCRDGKKNFIDELTRLVKKPASETDRLKIIALLTIEVHSRNIIDQLFKYCTSPNSFEWMKQLKFSENIQQNVTDSMDCDVEQTNAKFAYGFEYQGNNGRLVVTDLTDRCYMTLTTAMLLKKGGAPQGPAGTGKTETVKDLGKAMGKFVLVFNCSEGLDYKSIGRMFSGLVQTGGWGCFDEFNRIEIEVLSVVAQQIYSILDALKEYPGKQNFPFEGEVIAINDQCAIFITMNPGYAGRTELPDNLKSLFRPISMMVPDSALICEIMLQSEGFKFGKPLSLKIVTLYNLMIQQLSKQDHYDFGLRAIKSVLTCAGRMKREKGSEGAIAKDKGQEFEQDEQFTEQTLLMRAIRVMNQPKFVAEDMPLFEALFNDLFTRIEIKEVTNTTLKDAIELEMKKDRLQLHAKLVEKTLQLQSSMRTRHGNMIVGQTLSGKSTCWKLLQKAMNTIAKEMPNGPFTAVKIETLNPKAVTINELFGFVDPVSNEWNEGVLSSMMGRLCKDESLDQRWMILDGPVDTFWIESMNTVLDDNKILTLLNGDRISMPSQMGLIFEVEDLAAASPATVSRCGMVYLDINDLNWEPYAQSWIEKKADEMLREYLSDLFDKWVPRIINVKKNLCKELVTVSETALVMTFCKLLDSIARIDNTLNWENPKKDDIYWSLLEKWFTFALVWSIGATVNEDGRNLVDYHMRDIESMFPHVNTVYDYFVNTEKNEWGVWDQKLGTTWKPNANIPFYKMFVPTVDTIRNHFIITMFLKNKIHTLSIGITGTGKTSLINGILQELDESSYIANVLIFSGQTTSLKVQEIIESKLIRRTKNKMIPDGKKAVIFIDDLNMPKKDKFGSQPPLELIRQWMDYEGWFDRTNRDLFKFVMDIQFIAAMGPPGGGRAEISRRVLSKFAVLNFTFPIDKQVQRIFQSILSHKFSEFDEDIKLLSEPLAIATLNLFKNIQEQFLPTPAKSHYVFNMRDMSKVIQGIYQVNRFYVDNKVSIYRVWVHESLRVYYDRLVSEEDRLNLKKLISEQLELNLLSNMNECTNEQGQDTLFVDFFDEQGSSNVYKEVLYTERPGLKKLCEDKLKEYNERNRNAMNIVLFQEAVSYLCKIHRIIKLGRGHGLLVGEGGSGRHSLSRLAAHLAEYKIWQIEITKNYRLKEFREDIKRWSEEAGVKNHPGVFIFSDNEILNEGFIEDINNILSVGEVPNLFSTKEDLPAIKDKVKKDYYKFKNYEKDVKVTDDELLEFFFSRVQENFHLMICMSQTGDNLRNYARLYPGLVNNTTMIWFMPWPEDALVEVANHNLEVLPFDQEIKNGIASFFGIAHTTVITMAHKMFRELKRLYYVTPTNYIELVKGYSDLLALKQKELGDEINKLSLGLQKLEEAAQNSEDLTKQLGVSQIELSKKSKECEDLVIKIENDQINARESEKEVERRKTQVDKEKAEIEHTAKEAQADLEKAEPVLLRAQEGLDNLSKDSLAEIKSFTKPPPDVNIVVSVIMTILGNDPSWASAKKELADPNFLRRLKMYDKDNMSQNTIKKIEKYTHRPEMTYELVEKKSHAAGCMWAWVLAMEQYAKAFKDIEPKRKKVNFLTEKLKKSEEELEGLKANVITLRTTIMQLNDNLIRFKSDMESYLLETNKLQRKLDLADKLLSGLASTKEGWAVRKKKLEQSFDFLVGDCLISAAFLSYAGPFPSDYRETFVNKTLKAKVKDFKIPYTRDFNFSTFLVNPAEFLHWSVLGLPDDNFSQENGVLVTQGRRWPLMIDPQMQANKWIKNMERVKDADKLIFLDPQTENYMRQIEVAISQGNVVILQNLDEDIDPALEPVLAKNIKKVAGKFKIYIGNNEVLYDPHFKLYMTTKLANPKYKAEVSTKVTLVNFTVKENGLEEQLLSVIIREMEVNLENTRTDLIDKEAQNKRKLKEVDDDILDKLQNAKGSLVDDENLGLIDALHSNKALEEEAKRQIEHSQAAMRKTNAARENYRQLGAVASKLYFIINDFAFLNNMYQFSLESYINLFASNIKKYLDKNPTLSDSLQEKLDTISDRHKQEVFKYCCRGLFECDKQLLAFQMAVRLSKEIDLSEYNFFLRGAQITDRKGQPGNPNPDWITEKAWDNICELEKMVNFNGIIGAFVHNSKGWKTWYMSSNPEIQALPGEWANKCDTLRKMIMLKTIRPDRVLFAASSFIEEKMGGFYTNPSNSSSTDWNKIFEDTATFTKSTPCIFILSAGVDPFHKLDQIAKEKEKTLHSVSLGQGQSQKAKDKVYDGIKKGEWIYLANCHLSLSFLRELEKMVENLDINKHEIQEGFRLFLSSNPHPKFPISILQKSIRITTEPQKGIKANMNRLYNIVPEDKFKKIAGDKFKYKKLLFALSWFHSIIIERRRFKSLGWNVIYDFNDSDWDTSDRILEKYVEVNLEKPVSSEPGAAKSVQWDAIRYLISEVIYGGRVTDEWDRRLLNVYSLEFFNDAIFTENPKPFKLGEGSNSYVIPIEPPQKEGGKQVDKNIGVTPDFFIQKIEEFPNLEQPETFGQHINAEISSQITDTNSLIDSIISLQPNIYVEGEESRESKVSKIIKDLLERLPEQMKIEDTKNKLFGTDKDSQKDPHPLHVVLVQEMARYNKLLFQVKISLIDLDKGINGFVVISEELETIMYNLYENRVPEKWKFCYHSLKPLQSWMQDLIKRIEQLNEWAQKGQLNSYWISGFSFPTGFTTALQQVSARKLDISIDSFGWEFNFLPMDAHIGNPPKEGAYLSGLYLEGARWDYEKNFLIDAEPMKLHYAMPHIHFKPIVTEGKAKQKKGQNYYLCPTFMYPIRGGVREKPSFMFSVQLPCKGNPTTGTSENDFWIKRGTALLMSLAE